MENKEKTTNTTCVRIYMKNFFENYDCSENKGKIRDLNMALCNCLEENLF